MLMLGLCTYLSKVILNFPGRTALRKLLKKKQCFVWNYECQNEFPNLKEHLTDRVIMKFYDVSKPVQLQNKLEERYFFEEIKAM